MDTDALCGASISVDGVNMKDLDMESVEVQLSTNGEVVGELGKASEAVTYVELHLACASEKLVNLSILTMEVGTRESDFEAFVSEEDIVSIESAQKVMEYDLLSGILDSEVEVLDKDIVSIQTELASAKEKVSPCKHLGETFMELEEKLNDCEKSLEKSKEQLSEIRTDSSRLKRTLPGVGENRNHYEVSSEDGQFLNGKAEIKIQTAEQQRHILRMLEKSLAREIDLKKKLSESRQYEEELKIRLVKSEQELFCREEEVSDVWVNLIEVQNAAEVFMGISKELLGRIQILQFNMNGSFQREAELRSKFEGSQNVSGSSESSLQSSKAEVDNDLLSQIDSLRACLTDNEEKMNLAESEASALREEVTDLEKQLKESKSELSIAKSSIDESQEKHDIVSTQIHLMEIELAHLNEKLSEAGVRAKNAEVKSESLAKTNMALSEELDLLKKASGRDSEKIELLERQLREAEIQRQHAVATAEANQEKQNILYSAIGDMENLIKDLKLKVSKAESRADNAEENCVILSETNAELNEEVRYMRDRLESLEVSVNQAEESKMETAKDIGIHTKLIAKLVMQVAVERERLHKQMSSLALENKRLAEKLQGRGSTVDEMKLTPKYDSKDHVSENNDREDAADFSLTSSKLQPEEMEGVTSEETDVEPSSGLENVRRIDARMLSCNQVAVVMLFLLPLVLAYYIQVQNRPSS